MKRVRGLADREADLDRLVLVKMPLAVGVAVVAWIAILFIFDIHP